MRDVTLLVIIAPTQIHAQPALIPTLACLMEYVYVMSDFTTSVLMLPSIAIHVLQDAPNEIVLTALTVNLACP